MGACGVCVCVCVCVRACVRACVRGCVFACVRACGNSDLNHIDTTGIYRISKSLIPLIYCP